MELLEVQRHKRYGSKENRLSDFYCSVDNSLHQALDRDNNRSLFAFPHRWFIFPFRYYQGEGVLEVGEGEMKKRN